MFRKIFAGCLTAILAPVFILTIIAFNSKSTILNLDFWKNQLANEQIYSKLITDVLPEFASTLFNKNEVGSQIDKQVISDSIKSNITPNWLSAQLNTAIDSINDYLSGKTTVLNGSVDLRPVKTTLNLIINNTASANLNGSDLKNLPKCTDAELKEIQPDSNSALKCLPSEFDLTTLEKNQFSFDGAIPDNYNLSDLTTISNNVFGKIINQAKQVFAIYNIILLILSGVIVLLLIAINLLIWKPVISLIKWSAAAVLIPNLLLLLVSSMMFFGLQIFISSLILPSLPAAAITILSTSISAITSKYLFSNIIITGIFVFIAIILYIIAYILNKKNQPKKIIKDKNAAK